MCSNDIVQNKNIVIVDDIMTTGATLDTTAKLLLDYGAKSVSCVTIASTMVVGK